MRAVVVILVVVLLAGGGYWAYQQYAGRQVAAGREEENADQRAFFEALFQSTPAAAPAGETEFRSFAEAASGILKVVYGDVSEGVAKNVVITPADNDAIGVRIDEMRLWGVAAAALETLQSGGSADGVMVAERLDARGVAWFGFDALTEEWLDAYADTVSEAVEGALEGGAGENAASAFSKAMEQNINRYELTMERAIIDGLTLFPVAAPYAPFAPNVDANDGGDAETGLLTVFAGVARWSRTFALDAAAFSGMSADFAYTQMGGDNEMTIKAPMTGYRGYRRGDVDLTLVRGLEFEAAFEVPVADEGGWEDLADEPEAEVERIAMAMTGGVDLYTIEDMKLAAVSAFLERGEIPPMSETEIMSLGVWRALGEGYTLGGEPFYSVNETVVDLSDFHWLLPEKISFRSDDVVYNIAGYLAYVGRMVAASGEEGTQDAAEAVASAVGVLEDNGADILTFDVSGDGAWTPGNGATRSDFVIDLEDWMRIETRMSGGLPAYDRLQGAAPAAGAPLDGEALSALFLSDASLGGFSTKITDQGGLARGFELAVALADLAEPGDPGVAMLQGARPADLRVSSAAMIRLAAGQAAEAFPPGQAYLVALADFVQKGGVLTIAADPAAPLNIADIQAAAAAGDPADLDDLLGVSVTREAK